MATIIVLRDMRAAPITESRIKSEPSTAWGLPCRVQPLLLCRALLFVFYLN